MENMKEIIRDFILDLGVDDVGFTSVDDYQSPRSQSIESIFPGVKSMIVMAFRELSACESLSPQLAMNGRLDLMAFTRSVCYRAAHYVETQFGSPAVTIPTSHPMDYTNPQKIGVGEVSLRHAAVSAGLGSFGLHNLVVHPKFGTRVIFTAVLTKLELASDPAVGKIPCTRCGLCVQACPVGALDDEGKTDTLKCLGNSQPYGMRANIGFWCRFCDATNDERKAMLQSTEYLSLYHAGSIGYQYFCFRCLAACPVGQICS